MRPGAQGQFDAYRSRFSSFSAAAIVGSVNSGVALAIIDIAQKNQIPLMDTIATAEQVIERYQKSPKNYIFRVSLNDGIQTSIMIDYINARKYQRIGLMGVNEQGTSARNHPENR